MDIIAVSLVLSAAIMHATWNALVKSAEDKAKTFCCIFAIGVFGSALFLPFVPIPDKASWPYLLASVLIHTAYFAFLLKAYTFGDLSKVYPIARGSSPLLVALGSFLFASETLNPLGYAGMIVACLGIMAVSLDHNSSGLHDRKALFYAFGTGILVAGYTVSDGIGVRNTEEALSYILWLFVLEALPFAIWFLLNIKTYGPYYKRDWKMLTLGGIVSHLGYGLVIAAMALGNMASVSALRETSVIFATIIGAVFLHEKFGRWRIIGAIMVTSGIILLQIFG